MPRFVRIPQDQGICFPILRAAWCSESTVFQVLRAIRPPRIWPVCSCWLVWIKRRLCWLFLLRYSTLTRWRANIKSQARRTRVARFSTEMMVNLSMRLTMAPSPYPVRWRATVVFFPFTHRIVRGTNPLYSLHWLQSSRSMLSQWTEATHKIRALESIQRAKQ